MYYVLLGKEIDCPHVLNDLKMKYINSVFHNVPLNSSDAGKRYCRTNGELPITDRQADRSIRLPLWVGLSVAEQSVVISALASAFKLSPAQ